MIPVQGIVGFILKAIIVCIVPNVINLVVFYKADEFKELKSKVVDPILTKIGNKFGKNLVKN